MSSSANPTNFAMPENNPKQLVCVLVCIYLCVYFCVGVRAGMIMKGSRRVAKNYS